MSSNRLSPPETCRDFALLLPLASHLSLAPEVSARLNAHLASCARCRDELRSYERIDATLVREFATRHRLAPRLSREELQQVLHGRRFRLTRKKKGAELINGDEQTGYFDVGTLASYPLKDKGQPRHTPALFAAVLTVLTLSIAAAGLFHLLQVKSTTGTLAKDLSQVHLTDLAMVSDNEGWAIGSDAANAGHGVIFHYSHDQWLQMSAPGGVGAFASIAMLSASDGWIVGAQGLILHYDGQSWQSVQSPVHTPLGSIAMVSPTEGWAVGNDLLHYSHGAWTRVAGCPDFLSQFQMLSSTEGWAVGSRHIWHYVNNAWIPSIVRNANSGAHFKTPPNYPFTQPQALSISMLSSSEGWAVGPGQENMLHYQKGQWQPAQSPDPSADLQAVAMVSPGEGWAMGVENVPKTNVIYHYLNGHWGSIISPTSQAITRIIMLSPDEGWAVGSAATILHFYHGTWSVAFSG